MSDDRHRHLTAHVGGHVEKPEDDLMFRTCREAVTSAADLHHIAFYTDRVLDFALDVLDDEDEAPAGVNRVGLRRLGRQLCNEFEQLDQLVRNGRTGVLIRVVLRTADTEIVCDPVVRQQFVVGTSYTEGHDYIDESNDVDRSVAALIGDLRALVGLNQQNPGGFETEYDELEIGQVPSEPHVEIPDGDSPLPPHVATACRNALDPAYLHLVAYCHGDEVLFLADTFEHRTMHPYFGRETTPNQRRAHYRTLSAQLSDISTTLNRVSANAVRSKLKRIVLDVEQGAVYCYRLDNSAHLVGVTLYQPRVRHADLRMARLAHDCDVPLGSVRN
jgi:hypothetical protein